MKIRALVLTVAIPTILATGCLWGSSSASKDSDIKVEFGYSGGPVPAEYQQNATVTITGNHESGTATFDIQDGLNKTTQDVQVPAEMMQALYDNYQNLPAADVPECEGAATWTLTVKLGSKQVADTSANTCNEASSKTGVDIQQYISDVTALLSVSPADATTDTAVDDVSVAD